MFQCSEVLSLLAKKANPCYSFVLPAV